MALADLNGSPTLLLMRRFPPDPPFLPDISGRDAILLTISRRLDDVLSVGINRHLFGMFIDTELSGENGGKDRTTVRKAGGSEEGMGMGDKHRLPGLTRHIRCV